MEGLGRARSGQAFGAWHTSQGDAEDSPFPSYRLPQAALASSRFLLPVKGDEFVFGGRFGLPAHQTHAKGHAHLAVAHTAHRCWRSSMDLSRQSCARVDVGHCHSDDFQCYF